MTTNRPLRELVAEANAEVMEEIEDNREEGEEDDAMELTVVPNLDLFLFSLSLVCPFTFFCHCLFLKGEWAVRVLPVAFFLFLEMSGGFKLWGCTWFRLTRSKMGQ